MPAEAAEILNNAQPRERPSTKIEQPKIELQRIHAPFRRALRISTALLTPSNTCTLRQNGAPGSWLPIAMRQQNIMNGARTSWLPTP